MGKDRLLLIVSLEAAENYIGVLKRKLTKAKANFRTEHLVEVYQAKLDALESEAARLEQEIEESAPAE